MKKPTDRLIGLSEAAELLGVGISTLRFWDTSGKLPALRTAGGHRRYRLSDIERLQGQKPQAANQAVTAVYCRVSSHEQKKSGDLDRQKGRVLQRCVERNYKVGHVLEDVGSGMSSNRVQLRQLFKLATQGKIDRVVIENKDRLSRFYFDIFVLFFESQGVTVEWINETLTQSYEDELVGDIVALMSSFSAKIYGRRSAENRRKKKDQEVDS
ncbi:IS607 family transposase [Myxococcota bacterium]|nr:IS607 family transposase [Myxococcota bacterium]